LARNIKQKRQISEVPKAVRKLNSVRRKEKRVYGGNDLWKDMF